MVGMEAAFFDLDKTVIDRASIAAFGRPFMKGGLINRRVVARAALSRCAKSCARHCSRRLNPSCTPRRSS
jgi:hypothetical protein